jgi:hypothetical protein
MSAVNGLTPSFATKPMDSVYPISDHISAEIPDRSREAPRQFWDPDASSCGQSDAIGSGANGQACFPCLSESRWSCAIGSGALSPVPTFR